MFFEKTIIRKQIKVQKAGENEAYEVSRGQTSCIRASIARRALKHARRTIYLRRLTTRNQQAVA